VKTAKTAAPSPSSALKLGPLAWTNTTTHKPLKTNLPPLTATFPFRHRQCTHQKTDPHTNITARSLSFERVTAHTHPANFRPQIPTNTTTREKNPPQTRSHSPQRFRFGIGSALTCTCAAKAPRCLAEMDVGDGRGGGV
jgi:hypothetical protein